MLEAAILAAARAGEAIRARSATAATGSSPCATSWQLVRVGGALAATRDFVRDEPVLVQHGDALLRERMRVHVSAFARERLDALALAAGRLDAGPTS